VPFRIPVALNPFKTRVPTTRLGALGKSLNPLNPVNAGLMLLEEAIEASPLPKPVKAFAAYAQFGMPGIIYGLTERPAGPVNERRLIDESIDYFPQRGRIQQTTQTAAPAQLGPRVDRSTRQAQAQQPVSPESPQVIPATLVKPPTFPTTPAGQFNRYFQTPELDYVFGSQPQEGIVPKTVEEMLTLAKQLKAPTDTGLSTYYRAQSAAGRGQMEDIKKELGYAEGSDLATWAEANPMLAQRLYAQKLKEKGMAVSED